MKVVHITDRKAQVASLAMFRWMQQADAYYNLMRSERLRKAFFPDSNVIPFPLHRTRGYGGSYESA